MTKWELSDSLPLLLAIAAGRPLRSGHPKVEGVLARLELKGLITLFPRPTLTPKAIHALADHGVDLNA